MAQKLVIDCSLSKPPDEREQYVDLTPEEEAQGKKDAKDAVKHAWHTMRMQRNARLTGSDWTQLPGVTLDAETKARWDDYRQALRDLPASTVNPMDPQWPGAPGGP